MICSKCISLFWHLLTFLFTNNFTVMTLTAFNYTIDVTTKLTRFIVDVNRHK